LWFLRKKDNVFFSKKFSLRDFGYLILRERTTSTIKGIQSAKTKYLPPEKEEPGTDITKGYGEGSFTYTLPSK
jgi:hypothetical protein